MVHGRAYKVFPKIQNMSVLILIIGITFEPCALNAEFQHFMLRFNKLSLL